jgi:hypothetical protein
MWIAYRNNNTGFTAIKEYCGDVKECEYKMKKILACHSKKDYHFYTTNSFFEPFVNQLYNKSYVTQSSRDTVPDSVFETTTIGSNHKQ